MKTKIFLNNKNWYKYSSNGIEVFYKGINAEKNCKKLLNNFKKFKKFNKFNSYFNSLDNNFSIIIKKKQEVYAAVDRIRSFPLLYYYDRESFYLFENYQLIKDLNLDETIDKKQIFYFSLSGYTFADGTIYKNIKQINQGSYIHFTSNKVKKFNYYLFNNKVVTKLINLEKELKNVNEKVILKLIKSCKNKKIVIPLSAGYDSRFILSGLKEYGYNNILTFSYGRKNNREVEIAKALSKTLNVPWHYIPFTNQSLKKARNSKEHLDYEAFADNLTSVHFPQDYMAINYLRKKNIIPKNSVIVNGQSGDFISGNHLPNLDYNNNNIIKLLISEHSLKHYNLWNIYYEKNKLKLHKLILEYIHLKIPNIYEKDIYKIYEYLEFENRQCKYVINGQRLYDFFDYEWRLPLWDKLYLEFWAKVPLKEKINQSLYKRTLHETNWSGVWNNIPINPKNSFSQEMNIIRFIFKALFVFHGKEYWYLFENKYLDYFISPLCGYAKWKYKNIINDKRRFRNSVSWETENYLNNKKIKWENLL